MRIISFNLVIISHHSIFMNQSYKIFLYKKLNSSVSLLYYCYEYFCTINQIKKIMKKIVIALVFFWSISIFNSCGSMYTFNNFYNDHKNDMNSTAFQLPRFMTNILSGMSPEINSLFANVYDFKFITIENTNSFNLSKINTQINLITDSRFTDIVRNTQEKSRLVISGKEFNGIVKELVYFNVNNNTINAFYLKGNLNTNTIKQLAEKGELENFTSKLKLEAPNSIIPNTTY